MDKPFSDKKGERKPKFRKAGGKPKFPKAGGKPKFSAVKKKVPPAVKEICQEHKLTVGTAFKVYRGEIPLEQALQQDSEKEKRKVLARAICEKYKEINMALACMLVKQNMTPEEYFQKKESRLKERKNKDVRQKETMMSDQNQQAAFDALAEYCKNGTPLELAKYGGATQKGILQDFTPYEFFFCSQNKVGRVHRLELKYFFLEQSGEAIKKWIMTDKNIQQKKLKPSYKPVGRYQFPEGVLQNEAEIMVALHEGEMIRGKIVWFTPYDILLLANKHHIWVFRHAVVECALIRKPPKKD